MENVLLVFEDVDVLCGGRLYMNHHYCNYKCMF